jgi:tRNA (uracil-5-)-methyltransferase TRM9
MDKDTIQRLNAINREFYETTAPEFDQTRGKAWVGWLKLSEYLTAPLSVLDVGCGNGRFGVFLAESFSASITYHGIDNNRALLDYARTALAPIPHLTATLTEQDIITQPPDSGTYNLVVLFGVIHHIPGAANRLAFMRQLAERVAPDGLLAWDANITVEQGDYLLDWRRGERALRYCHYVDDSEQSALIAATGLTEIETYRADGEDNRMNAYSILGKK